MRRKRCIFCGGLNTKRHGSRSRRRRTAFGKKIHRYQRWFCNACARSFVPQPHTAINFSFKIKACELYYDAEASYRAVSRQVGLAPYRLFEIIDTLGANCKSTLEVSQELCPQWSGYLFIDEKSLWIKGIEWYLLIAVDLGTQDIVHWDLVPHEDDTHVAWFLMVIQTVIRYPFKGVISDLYGAFIEAVRWLLPGIPHQFCTYHAYRSTEFYLKYHYTGRDRLWAERFLTLTRIICRCDTLDTAKRALEYLQRHHRELRQAKLARRAETLIQRFPFLIKRFKDRNLRPDNNIVENVIRQLNQKFKKVAGFKSYQTAYNSISLVVMRYRFHRFSCSRISGNNGKSPLELAGVDTANMNWVKFSQKNNACG